MDVTFFSAKAYEKPFFAAASERGRHTLHWIDARLTLDTAALALGRAAVCVFVQDRVDAPVLEALHRQGVRFVVLRSAGFNNVDVDAAEALGIAVARVPAYSPHAIAEYTVALMLDLNRKIYRAYPRVREGNFSLDGLMGVDMHGLTAGIVGTGTIGRCVGRILAGFGLQLLAFDPHPNDDAKAIGMRYVPLPELLARSDIVTLHCPLTPQTRYLIDAAAVAMMKDGAMLINTSRGAVIDTPAVIDGLKSGRIGSLGLDVYEEEESLFFRDLSDTVIQDDVFSRLLTFPNVIVTGHQGFFTRDALDTIARVTLANLDELERTGTCTNCVAAKPPR
jgi:D-lactate dehydrogenase